MAQTVKATRRVALGKLKAYPRNPRRGDVAAIKASLEAHGQYRALVVNKDGTVLAGNHTLLALRETGARDALCHFVDVDEDVYDPFVGSGTTLIACENLSRRCYAMEIDPGYVDVCVDRWERHTQRTATLER